VLKLFQNENTFLIQFQDLHQGHPTEIKAIAYKWENKHLVSGS